MGRYVYTSHEKLINFVKISKFGSFFGNILASNKCIVYLAIVGQLKFFIIFLICELKCDVHRKQDRADIIGS